MPSNNTEVKCISPEIGKAGEMYRQFSLYYLCVAVVVIISGLALLFWARHNIWIKRRNPLVICLLIVPLAFNLSIGPLYRLLLNTENNFIATCPATNFLLVVVIVTMLIPNLVRIKSYYNRVKLNQAVARIDEKSRRRSSYNGSFNLSQTNATADVSTSISFIYQCDKKLRFMKYKASSKFATQLALTLLIFFILASLLFAVLTCPNQFLGRGETCIYGFSIYAAIVIVLPLFPVIGVFFLYRSLSGKAPDPFRMRREFNIFLGFASLLLLIFIADMLNLGKYKPNDLEATDVEINFKLVQLVDIVFLAIFIHAVHYQVYLGVREKNSLQLEVPIGLREILGHKEGTQLLRAYLETEFSVEALVVYKMLKKWKRRVQGSRFSPEFLDEQAVTIFTKYIDDTENALSINVGYSLKDELRAVILNREGNIGADFFDKVLDTLYDQMASNGFTRFVNTMEYKVFAGLSEPVYKVQEDME